MNTALHLLQTAPWPRGITVGAPELLYFRAEPHPVWDSRPEGGLRSLPISASRGAQLEFSTFFGAFSLTTWCGAAAIDAVVVELELRGRCILRVFEDNGYEGRSLLWESRVDRDGTTPMQVPLSGLKGRRGILFPVLDLHAGDEIELRGLRYLTPKSPAHASRLAIVMPTYRREAYALRNIELIRTQVLEPSDDACRLFVVDNAHTLDLPETPGITLLRNRNFGGSGGFARGVLEAAGAAQAFSHVLFCDDDVLIDPNAILRVQALLGYVAPDCIVSGGMLKMGQKHLLHEKSSNVVGMRFSSNKSNRDLTTVEAVARYDEQTYATFCGWWFVCYPLGSRKDDFLPFPFFVGWDDVEMGLRCNRLGLPTLSLLGAAIWHEEFEKKDINWRWFYHVRNGLVTAALYDGSRRALHQSFREILNALHTYRYERAEFMLDGLDQLLRGGDAIRTQPADALHQQLMLAQKIPFADLRDRVIPDRYFLKPRWTRTTVFFARLTLNGHLLPKFLFKSAAHPSHAGWAVENLHSQSLVRIFRCPRVVYYEPVSGKGLLCDFDRPRYFRLLFRLLLRWGTAWLRWGALRRSWREEHRRLTSPEFWRGYLGLSA